MPGRQEPQEEGKNEIVAEKQPNLTVVGNLRATKRVGRRCKRWMTVDVRECRKQMIVYCLAEMGAVQVVCGQETAQVYLGREKVSPGSRQGNTPQASCLPKWPTSAKSTSS